MTDHELGRTTLSEYDVSNRPMRKTTLEGTANVYLGEVTYDEHNNLESFREQVGANRAAYRTNFAYDTDNRPTVLTYGSESDKVEYTYDGVGRVSERTVTVGNRAYSASYSFVEGGHNSDEVTCSTTGLIANIEQTGGNFTYAYDDNGNITSVMQDGKTTSYVYDALSQLIRVDDQNDTTSGSSGTTWVYEYDLGGNILSKKRYAYKENGAAITVADEVLESMIFGYVHEAATLDATQTAENKWRDLLKYVNGKRIGYDEIGNPTQVGEDNDADKVTYTWEKGRQLKSMSNGSTTASFKYNADGLRVQKTVGSVVTNYTLHGKNIVHMTQGSNELHFFYDAQNKPAVVVYNGTPYSYVKNLQGDIVAILDSTGSIVVEYKYDAWGRPISTSGTMASTLGALNPFRYRGYVFDEETGLYYLRSRYYIAVWSRFLNADAMVKLRWWPLASNSFSYCSNQPTSCDDQDGFDESQLTQQLEDFFSAIEKRGAGSIKYKLFGNGEWSYSQKEMQVAFSPGEEIGQFVAEGIYNGGLGMVSTAVTSNVWVGGAIGIGTYISGKLAEIHLDASYPSIPSGTYTYETATYREVTKTFLGDLVYTQTYHYVWGKDVTNCDYFAIWTDTRIVGPGVDEYWSDVLNQRAH